MVLRACTVGFVIYGFLPDGLVWLCRSYWIGRLAFGGLVECLVIIASGFLEECVDIG